MDEVLATVVGLGFEWDVAQAAVEAGATTTEAAVEWIINRQTLPTATTTAVAGDGGGGGGGGGGGSTEAQLASALLPRLVLSAPTATPAPAEVAQALSAAGTPTELTPTAATGPASRFDAFKGRDELIDRVEEKQRLEAIAKAQERRKAESMEKKRVMQQIEEDRRERKERRTGVPAPAASTAPALTPTPAAVPIAAPPASASATVQVQLRLSSGRPVRSTFASTATLAELATWARSNGETANFYFVQPFPQRSFEHTDPATASLADLGLAPTASLAVRKRPDAPAAPVVEAQPAVVQERSPTAPMAQDIPPAPGSPMAEDSAADDDEGDDEDEEGALADGMDGDDAPEMRDDEEEEDDEASDDDNDNDADQGPPPPFARWGAPGRGFGRGGANILPIAPPLGGRRRPGPALPQAEPQRLGSGAGSAAGDDIRARRAAALSARPEVPAPTDTVSYPTPAAAVAVAPPRASNPQARELARGAAAARQQHQAAAPSGSAGAAVVRPAPAAAVPLRVRSLLEICLGQAADYVCTRKSSAVSGYGMIGPDLGGQLAALLIKEGRLDRFSLLRLVPCHLTNLDCSAYRLATNDLLLAVGRLRSLKSLSLRSAPYVTDAGLENLKNLVRLRSLELGGCKLTSLCVPPLLEMEQLTYLGLHGTKVDDDAVAQICKHLKQLTQLDLGQCSRVTSVALLHLQELPQLAVLALDETGVTDLTSFRAFLSLTSLTLSRNVLVGATLHYVGQRAPLQHLDLAGASGLDLEDLAALRDFSRLTTVAFPDREMALDPLLDLVRALPLQRLDLSGFVNVTDEGAAAISDLGATLTWLSLAGTRITDAAMPALARLHRLEELYLDRTDVTKTGVVALAGLPLSVLSLSDTQMNDAGLQGLLSTLLARHLRRLNLTHTAVTDDGVRHLQGFPLLRTVLLDYSLVTPACLLVLNAMPNLDRVRLNGIDAAASELDATTTGRAQRREEQATRSRRRHGPNPTAAGAMPRVPRAQGLHGAHDDGDDDGEDEEDD